MYSQTLGFLGSVVGVGGAWCSESQVEERERSTGESPAAGAGAGPDPPRYDGGRERGHFFSGVKLPFCCTKTNFVLRRIK